MSRPTVPIALAALLSLVVLAAPLPAHHAFSAEFDANLPVQLEGSITKVEWINPHCWVHIEVTTDDGSKEAWMIEGGTPNTLARRGFNRNTLEPGTRILVDGYRSKDGTNKANGRNVTLPDGSRLFMGSSGTGAPRDGADPTEPPRR